MWDNYIEEVKCLDSKLFEDMPDFLIISPPKTGTTWLFENLRCHPQVYMPECKEIRYFCTNWRFFDINWYLQHFKTSSGLINGEASPSYSILPSHAIQMIGQLNPNLKLIFLMRDPIERAWSHAKHNLRFRSTNFRKFEGMQENVPVDKWTENFAYYHASYGNYQLCLQRWLEFFPKNQFYVGFFEDIKQDPQNLILEILKFLGVNTDIDLSGFPLSEKIFEGLKLEISAELTQVLRALYRKRTQVLKIFLETEFALKLPSEWSKTLVGEEIQKPIAITQNYCEWSIYLFKDIFYAVSNKSKIDSELINKLDTDLICKSAYGGHSLFQVKSQIAFGLANNKSKDFLNEVYEVHKHINIKCNLAPKSNLTKDKCDDIWLEIFLTEEIIIEMLVQSRDELQKALDELEKLYSGYPQPVLIKDFGLYNIVAWRGIYYGLPKELGPIDISSNNLSQLEGIFINISPEKLKNSIQNHKKSISDLEELHSQLQQTQEKLQDVNSHLQDTMFTLQQAQQVQSMTKGQLQKALDELEKLYNGYPQPVLVEDFGLYNIVVWRGIYYGLPKELGLIDISSTDLSQLKGIFINICPEKLKNSIQNSQESILKLEQLYSQLQQTQEELQDVNSHSQQTLFKLKQMQTIIHEMERSKFWKLRQWWMRVKRTLKLGE